MGKRWLLLLLVWVLSEKVIAQRSLIDSLLNRMEESRSNSNKVRLLRALAETYNVAHHQKSMDSAVYYLNKSLILARSIGNKKEEASSLLVLGDIRRNQANPVQAIQYYQQALRMSEEVKDTLGIIRGLTKYALLYYYKNDFRQELSYYLKVEALARKIDARQELNKVLGNIGKTYWLLKKRDSAEYYLQQAITLSTNEPDAFAINLMGRLKLEQQDYRKALELFNYGLELYKKKNDKFRIAKSYYDIAHLYVEQNKLDSALANYMKSFDQGSQVADSLYTIEGVGSEIAALHEKMQHLPEALRFYKIASAARERLKDKENLTKLLHLEFRDKERKQEMETAKNDYLNKVRLFFALSAFAIITIISFFLYRNNLNKKKTNVLLGEQNVEIERAFRELKQTQTQLIQAEKMASLGELTAGIAHEIQNPLNFVNNFSEVSTELVEELKQEATAEHLAAVLDLADNLQQNLHKIQSHGQRADAIVKNMLQHSRATTGQKQLTNLNTLAEEYLRLAYHGIRAKNKDFTCTLGTNFDNHLEKVAVVPQDLGRVLLNLYNNAFYAVEQKANWMLAGPEKSEPGYQPTVSVTTKKVGDGVEIKVKDNGTGLSESLKNKIFQPFFTTKPTGQGTGLGLSLSYDIIKAHGGQIMVHSAEGEFTEFVISLPKL